MDGFGRSIKAGRTHLTEYTYLYKCILYIVCIDNLEKGALLFVILLYKSYNLYGMEDHWITKTNNNTMGLESGDPSETDGLNYGEVPRLF